MFLSMPLCFLVCRYVFEYAVMFMSMSLCFCVIKPGFVRSRSIYIYIHVCCLRVYVSKCLTQRRNFNR